MIKLNDFAWVRSGFLVRGFWFRQKTPWPGLVGMIMNLFKWRVIRQATEKFREGWRSLMCEFAVGGRAGKTVSLCVCLGGL